MTEKKNRFFKKKNNSKWKKNAAQAFSHIKCCFYLQEIIAVCSLFSSYHKENVEKNKDFEHLIAILDKFDKILVSKKLW